MGTERLVDPFSLEEATGAPNAAVAPWSLDRIREEIARIDQELLAALARRARLTRITASREHSRGAELADPAQEAAVVHRAGEQAEAIGLDAEAIRDLYRGIVEITRPTRAEGAAGMGPREG